MRSPGHGVHAAPPMVVLNVPAAHGVQRKPFDAPDGGGVRSK